MNEVLSFFSVIALWMGMGFFAWLFHWRRSGARQQRETDLARQVAACVADAKPVFQHIRQGAPPVEGEESPLVQRTHALLRRIQERGAFFDEVSALRQQMRQALRGEECEPLAEILHIRRDLWAASEIILIEDVRSLGPAFADEAGYERMRGEAAGVLFQDRTARPGHEDLIDLRLSLASEEAAQLVADVEEAIRLAREHERLPTFSELIAYPVAAARALPGQYRTFRAQLAAFSEQVRAVAVTIRQSETMARGIGELRRAREELPKRVATGLEKTSAAARQSASSLKGHYDFLVQAYDVQAKYEDLLRKAPEATERGKQFIARLELAEKSERLKLTVSDIAKRLAVQGLAHLIAGLQRLQSALERRLAAAQQGEAAPEAAKQPPPAGMSLAAEPTKAPITPAAPTKRTAPAQPKEKASAGAKPSASARNDIGSGKSERPALRSQPTPGTTAARQAKASALPPVPPASSGTKPRAAKTSALARAVQRRAAQTEPPLPKLSLAGEKQRPTNKEQAAPITPKTGADGAPKQRRGWFGKARDRQAPAQASSVKAKEKSASMAASAAETSAPKKGGWFRSRRRGEEAASVSGSVQPALPAKGPSKAGQSLQRTSAAKQETPSATPPAPPATPEAMPPKKSRGWFGSRRSAKQDEAAAAAKAPLAEARASGNSSPQAVVSGRAKTLPVADAPEAAPALSERGGWFGSRRRSKGKDIAPQPVAEVEVTQDAPSVVADSAMEESQAKTSQAETSTPSPETVPPLALPAKATESPKASLSAKLTGAADIDPEEETFDNPEETELAADETEDDDPGPLTRGILESRAAAQPEDKPGRNHGRAFPWLRR